LYDTLSIMNVLRVKRKCLELLNRVERDGAYLHLVLQQEAHGSSLAPDEYPLLVQLVRGTLEQSVTIEEALAPFLSAGLGSLPPEVQNVLRLATYQLLFLDRSRTRDVVFEAVELVKSGRYRGLAKLVNAVLRKVGAQREEIRGDAQSNFPEWLVQRWVGQFGEVETKAFCDAANDRLPLYLRVATCRAPRKVVIERLQADGVECEPAPYLSESIRVRSLPRSMRLHQLSSYKEGLFFVQDLSSTIVAEIVSSRTPRLVYDLCAAPGGKACAVALSIGAHGGSVVATDRTPERVALIEEAVSRIGVQNVECRLRDALLPTGALLGQAEVVLVDAPCSGFGTVGRKVDVRWSKSQDAIQELVQVQGELLDRAASLVQTAGALVYSTCSIDRDENEGVVGAFLARHPDFLVSSLQGLLPAELVTPEGYYRSWPQRHEMAGAFGALLVRSGG
jgi:16S rRNA (cytosine967-C5)-methyltransferase